MQPSTAIECGSCGVIIAKWRPPAEHRPQLTTRIEPDPEQAPIHHRVPLLAIAIVAVLLIFGLRTIIKRAHPEPEIPREKDSALEKMVASEQEAKNTLRTAAMQSPSEGDSVIAGQFWDVRGEVLDLVTLGKVHGGTLRFTCFRMGCEASVDAAIDESGLFEAKLPQLKDSGYQITLLHAPEGYGGEPIVMTNGRLSRLGQQQRLAMMESTELSVTDQETVKGDQPGLQLALRPSRPLTQDERDLIHPPARD